MIIQGSWGRSATRSSSSPPSTVSGAPAARPGTSASSARRPCSLCSGGPTLALFRWPGVDADVPAHAKFPPRTHAFGRLPAPTVTAEVHTCMSDCEVPIAGCPARASSQWHMPQRCVKETHGVAERGVRGFP